MHVCAAVGWYLISHDLLDQAPESRNLRGRHAEATCCPQQSFMAECSAMCSCIPCHSQH